MKDFESISKALLSEDPGQIREACEALPGTCDERYLPLIKQALSNSGISGETRYALRKSYNAVIDACRLENNRNGSGESGEDIFGNLSSDSKIAALSLDHPDPDRRIAALRSVAAMNLPGLLSPLLEFLAREKDDRVLATFMKTIGRLGKGKADLVKVLSPYLSSANERVRANCVEGLELLACPEAIPHLAPLLRDQDNRVKANAAKALWIFGRREVLSFIEKMLQSTEEWERDSAVYALGFISSPASRELLISALDDTSPNVRAGAAAALERLRSQDRTSTWMTGTIGWVGSLILAALAGALIFMVLGQGQLISPPGRDSGSQTNGKAALPAPPDHPSLEFSDPQEAASFHHSNSSVYLARGDVGRAIEEAEKACKFAPEIPKYHLALAQIFGSIGNTADAMEALQKALALAPGDSSIRKSLATLYMDSGLYDKALPLLKELAAAQSGSSADSWLLTHLGLCNLKTGSAEQARKQLNAALALAPENPEVIMNMALMLQLDGDRDRAITLLRKASEKDPGNMQLLNRLAVALIRSGRPDQAMPILRKIILMAPRTLAAHQAGELLQDIHLGRDAKGGAEAPPSEK